MRSPTRAARSACRCTSPSRCGSVQRARRTLAQKLNRDPTFEEIGLESGHTAERVVELLELISDPVSLETPVGDGESMYGDLIEDMQTESPDAATATAARGARADGGGRGARAAAAAGRRAPLRARRQPAADARGARQPTSASRASASARSRRRRSASCACSPRACATTSSTPPRRVRPRRLGRSVRLRTHEKRCYVKSRSTDRGRPGCPFGTATPRAIDRAKSGLFRRRRGLKPPRGRRGRFGSAEHGARVGRSRAERPYAEAESQSVRWTKTPPARRIHGPAPFERRAQNASRSDCAAKFAQIAPFSSWGLLQGLAGPTSFPLAPSTERE